MDAREHDTRFAIGAEASYGAVAARTTFLALSALPTFRFDYNRLDVQGVTGHEGRDKAGRVNGNKIAQGEIECFGRMTAIEPILLSLFGYASAGIQYMTSTVASYSIEVNHGDTWWLHLGCVCTEATFSSKTDAALMVKSSWEGNGSSTPTYSQAGITAGSASLTELPLMHKDCTASYGGTSIANFSEIELTISRPRDLKYANHQTSQEVTPKKHTVTGKGKIYRTGTTPETTMLTNGDAKTLAAMNITWSNGTDSMAVSLTNVEIKVENPTSEQDGGSMESEFTFEAQMDGSTPECVITLVNA